MRSFDMSNDRLSVLHGLTRDDAPLSPPAQHPVEPKISLKPRSSSHPPPHSGGDNGNESSHTATENLEGAKDRSKSKFRFKRKKKSPRPSHREDERQDGHHRHYRSHRDSRPPKRPRHARQPKEVGDDPAAYDDTYIPNAASSKYANSDDAFRESLFDAMADDEGAAFWEGVYGQPINVYPRPEIQDERGKLERMEDEEYAKYVREKMWEKSHQHIIEERDKREREREERRERKRRDHEDRKKWDQAEKIRLREEKQRREKRARNQLRKRWDEYLDNWAMITGGTRVDVDGSGKEGKRPANLIPWPVESGKLSDISQEAVERFFLAAPIGSEFGNGELADILKLERVRWHPDKAQQRWGKGGIGEEELKGITAVFQAIDSLWTEHRGKKEGQA